MPMAAWVLGLATAAALTQVGGDWVDPQTSADARITESLESGRRFDLVFSDEFNTDGRYFIDGHDPKWTAINKNDYTNYAIHYYNHTLVSTRNGFLNITTHIEDVKLEFYDTKEKKIKREKKHYQSGMLQGWNKFCFTGGIIEISAQLPGRHDVAGLWPAMWLLGNLARATYVGSSNNVWPWSFDECQEDLQHQQLISKCNKVNHFGLHPHQGRGAPEIDILEAMAGVQKLYHTPVHRPYYSASLQVAPGSRDYRPSTGWPPQKDLWYRDNITYGANTSVNIFFYGDRLQGVTPDKDYVTDAVSANHAIGKEHFTQQHVYRVEWRAGPDGYISWHLDGELVYRITAQTLALSGTKLPDEPMYILLNTAMSYTWGFPDCPAGCDCTCMDCRNLECACALPGEMCANFPAHFLIDYVRVYQDQSDPTQLVGCSTPEHPTRQYIEGHKWLYSESGRAEVLRAVRHGGGKCARDSDCQPFAGYDGRCTRKLCQCAADQAYTGPHCKAARGFDDQVYDSDPPLSLYGAVWPSSLLALLSALVVALLMVVVWKYIADVQAKSALIQHQYTPIPDQP